IGGAIHLNSTQNFNKGLALRSGSFYGSFGDLQQNLDLCYSKKRFITSTKFFYHKAENNFPFYNITEEGHPLRTQKHAQLAQYGLMQENYFILSSRQKLNTHFWFQDNNRNIPPTLTQTTNSSRQKDFSYRGTAEWQRTGDRAIWFLRSALFNDNILYTDTTYRINEPSVSTSSISEAESRIALSKQHRLNLIVNNTWYKAYTASYNMTREQERIAVFAAYHFNTANERLYISANARQEFMVNTAIPLTWSLSAEARALKWLLFTANANRVFRLPTLNDQFWNPGGNPDLRPEEGYSEDAGLKISIPRKNVLFTSSLNLFNRNITNWIVWVPGINGIYSPQNMLSVWSRGMETKWELAYIKNKLNIKFNLNTSYVVSTNERKSSPGDVTFQKQLIYTPQYSGSANLSVKYASLFVNYNHTYTGYRYTLADNTEFLEPFQTLNLRFGYTCTIRKVSFSLIAKVNNLLNARYQVIQNYAMPLRNYQAGIIINYN
ncbi:MAG: hypothetical protein ACJ76F_09400, partial [Bacteroidia bacterium]